MWLVRGDGYPASSEMMHMKALTIACHMGVLLTELRATQFMKRNKMCICRQTKVCQRLPKEYKS